MSRTTVFIILIFVVLFCGCNAAFCTYPKDIVSFPGFKYLESFAKNAFINMFLADCLRTDGPCPPGNSPSCGTLNDRRTYLGGLPNPYEFTSSCDEIRTTYNLPMVNGYRIGLNPVRMFLQCPGLCNGINTTHFWSSLPHCPEWHYDI